LACHGKLLQNKDAAKSKRVMKAMMDMIKIDINESKQAYKQLDSITA